MYRPNRQPQIIPSTMSAAGTDGFFPLAWTNGYESTLVLVGWIARMRRTVDRDATRERGGDVPGWCRQG